MNLIPGAPEITGSVAYDGQEMVGADEGVLRQIRGNDISFIFQEPMTSLNPLHTLEKQITESLMLHQGLRGAAAQARGGWNCCTRSASATRNRRLGAYSAPAVGRAAAAGDDRHGAGQWPQAAGGRRTHHRARRDDPGAVLELLADLKRDMGMSLLFITH